MALSEEFLLELKSRNNIQDIISSYVAITKPGRNPKCLCPFHGEKTPSFTIYPETESFYCFGCGVGGDVIRFVRLMENLDYIDAVKFLAERSGLEMPVDGVDDTFIKKKRNIYSINRETAKFFYEQLYSPQGKPGLDYFHNRGLSDAVIKKFGLGFAPDSWDALYNRLKSKGFSDDDMILANVVGTGRNGGKYDRFRKRMMFPIIDVRGNVIAFSGRRLFDEDSNSKYINTSDTPVYKKSHNVYSLNFAKDFCGESIILCEGNMDVIAMFRAGFKNAVAPLGTSFTTEQAKLLSRYTDRIILMLDSDSAGQKATNRAISVLEQLNIDVRVATIPNGKDPDEFVKMFGNDSPAKMKQIIDNALSVVDFRLKNASNDLNTEQSDTDKLQFLEKAAEIISKISSSIERDLVAGRLAEQYGISKQSIIQRSKQIYLKNLREESKKESNRIIHPVIRDPINPESIKHRKASNAEEGLLSIIIRNPKLLETVQNKISPDDFITSFNRKVYEELLKRYKEQKPIDLTLMQGTFNEDEIEKIAKISAKGNEHLCNIEECDACINALKNEAAKQHVEINSDEQFLEELKNIKKTKK